MLQALLAAALIPMHGLVLAVQPNGTVIVRNNVVSQMLPSETRVYRLLPRVRLASGTGVDAFIDTSTTPWTLRDAVAAGPFIPGLPSIGRVVPVDYGSRLPSAQLVDQSGRLLSLQRAFLGKTLILSFVFTRCRTDDGGICPTISSKFTYLQRHLDPATFALAEISLDPNYDSPRILTKYARTYGADPTIWKMLTGEGITIQRLLNAFGISSLQVSTDDFLHSDKLFIVTPAGRVAYIIDTAQWDPGGVLAQARSVAGMVSNPFERFKLSLVTDVASFCGGSQWVGVVLLELSLFFIILIFVASGLWIVGRWFWGPSRQG